jgi:hypothetical protein
VKPLPNLRSSFDVGLCHYWPQQQEPSH